MDKEKLNQILKDHAEYLKTGDTSKRADLSSADLSSADLSSANLSSANLSYANLRSADLSSADLRYADLSYADLSYAELSYADLRSADLRYADLSYAELSYADRNYSPIQIINTKYFITILHDKVLWGCREFSHEEVRKLTLSDCREVWNKKEFEFNKRTIVDHIDFYFDWVKKLQSEGE